jgi:hypothetical protein
MEIEKHEVRANARQLKGTWTVQGPSIICFVTPGQRTPGKRYKGTYRYKTRKYGAVDARGNLYYRHIGLDVIDELNKLAEEHITKGHTS